MESSWGHRAAGAVCRVSRCYKFLAIACVLTLAGCNPDGQGLSAAQPRGATVAFDSVDGLPRNQFQKLVQDLNDEAQTRRLAVMSREQSGAAYRVRGYLAIKVSRRQTTVSWVWDVFDREETRALRISGEETVKVRHRDAWAAADDAMLKRIAQASMDQLAAFLTSTDVAPGTSPQPAPAEPQVALADPGESSPEAAGIFRISSQRADPILADTAQAPPEAESSESVPLPRRRPAAVQALSERDRLTVAASSN